VNAHLAAGKKMSKQEERIRDLSQVLSHVHPRGIVFFSGELPYLTGWNGTDEEG
jgi:hypothetical protein